MIITERILEYRPITDLYIGLALMTYTVNYSLDFKMYVVHGADCSPAQHFTN